MDTNSYLELMRFPDDWKDLGMVPDDDYIADHVFHLKPGMEHRPEHARHEAFHYWLAREPDKQKLEKLVQLSLVDPDTDMGESIRAEILKAGDCDDRLRAQIASHTD